MIKRICTIYSIISNCGNLTQLVEYQKDVIKMQYNTLKTKESVMKQDGSVEVVKEREKDFSKHLFALYSLLVLSFTLHFYVIVTTAHLVNNEIDKVNDRFLLKKLSLVQIWLKKCIQGKTFEKIRSGKTMKLIDFLS